MELAPALSLPRRQAHLDAQSGSRLEHRDLGGVSHRLDTGLGELSVVARGHRPREPGHNLWRSAPPRRAVPVGAHVECLPCTPDRGDSHPVLGQGSGLVRADHVRRAQRLHRAEALDDRAAAHQLADADRQRQRDHRQQSLGDVADQEAHREDDGVGEGQPRAEHAERHEGHSHQEGDERDEPRDPAHLGLQRAVVPLDPLRQRRDSSELGLHARREDHGLPVALRARGPGEHQVARLQQGHVRIEELSRPEHRHRLAAERREVHLDPAAEQPRIGRYAVAFLDHEHVAGHEARRLDDLLVSVAEHLRVRGQELRQRLDRPLRVNLLGEREARVDHDDRDDCDGHGHDSRRPGEGRRRPEQQGKGMGELARQLPRPSPPGPAHQHVGPVLQKPALCLTRGQARSCRLQVSQQQVGSLGRIEAAALLSVTKADVTDPTGIVGFAHERPTGVPMDPQRRPLVSSSSERLRSAAAGNRQHRKPVKSR